MNIYHHKGKFRLFSHIVATCSLLLFCLSASALYVDPFTSASRLPGWTDNLNGGSSAGYAVHAFPLASSGAGGGGLTSSKYTTTSYTTAVGHTLELRTTVVSIDTAANNYAVLAWVPTGQTVDSSSYNVRVGVSDIAIRRGSSTTLYSSNLVTSLTTTNVIVTIRITPNGDGSVDVTASVYKTGGVLSDLLFEATAHDASGLVGAGNAALGAENTTAGVATVKFFDLQSFDLTASIVDNFTQPDGFPAGWDIGSVSCTTCPFDDGTFFKVIGNQLEVQGIAAGPNLTLKNSPLIRITDGAKVEMSADLITSAQNNNYYFLAYFPNGAADYASANSYHIATRPTQATLVGKTIATHWFQIAPVDSINVRYTMRMTGLPGGAVLIESRIEDLDIADVNNPARILHEGTHVDATGAYISVNGFFGLGIYVQGTGSDAVFDNLTLKQTPSPNAPPFVVGTPSPKSGSNFVNASTTPITFTMGDDANIPDTSISLTLNGVLYKKGTAGVTIGGTQTARTLTLAAGILSPNTVYKGTISGTDNLGLSTTVNYEIDTFLNSNYVVECEDWNFSTNGTTGGVFIDGAVLLDQDGSAVNLPPGGTPPYSYNGADGLEGIDFHDTDGDNGWGTGWTFGVDFASRPDPADQNNSIMPARQKYLTYSGPGAVHETIVSDTGNGEWANYTRTYPAGDYNIYLRESTDEDLARSIVRLERVTSDPTVGSQTTVELGLFIQRGGQAGNTGGDQERDVALTDGAGNPVVVRFDGNPQTLRLYDRSVDSANGTVYLNYMVFVPASPAGPLGPFVGEVHPMAGSTNRVSPELEGNYAEIIDREVGLDTNQPIVLKMNGVTIPTTTDTNALGGHTVSWSLASLVSLPNYATPITNVLTYKDSNAVSYVYTWVNSYPLLRAANSLPIGSLTVPGFDQRTVWYNDGGTSLDLDAVSEQMLAIPPTLPVDVNSPSPSGTYRVLPTLDWTDAGAYANSTPPDFGAMPGKTDIENFGGTIQSATVEALAYLQLSKGPHRFQLNSDRAGKLLSGTSPTDLNAPLLAGIGSDDNFDGTVDFFAEADGLYPFRVVWFTDGATSYRLFLRSVRLSDQAVGLVGDPAADGATPAPAPEPVNAFRATQTLNYTLELWSSTTVNGTFTLDGSAWVLDRNARTVTVPFNPANPRTFYRLKGVGPAVIGSVQKVGSNIVINYHF